MSQEYEIVIVGGGIVGLCSALAMMDCGYSVALIDAGSMTTDISMLDARVYAINQASQDLLTRLGVWQNLQSSRLSPYQHMYVWDAANQAHIEFDARMVAAEHLGTIIEESVLKQALWEVLKQKKQGLALFPNTRINRIQPEQDCIKLFDSQSKGWHAQLLMIADGANSACRQLLEVPLTTWSYHQEALVALVNTELSHQQTACQVFNADGALAFLPMADEKLCSIVWSTTPSRVKELMTLGEEDFDKQLTRAFAAKLGQVKLQSARYQFPLTMRHAQQYVGSRWLLLGDAAHTIHPLAGLGLNVGFADIATWLSCCAKGNNPLISPSVLRAYQRQRKHAVWQIIALMEGLKTLFNNSLSPIVKVRGLGLRLCNGFPVLKRLFIEQAAGKKSAIF